MHNLDKIRLRRHHRVNRLVRRGRLVDHVRILPAFHTFGHAHVIFNRKSPPRLVARHRASRARMATLAQGARISVDLVREEIARLQASWPLHSSSGPDPLSGLLSPDHLSQLDLFDRLQLERVLDVCRHSRSLSDAGRTLFHASRSRKTTSNDADRLRKYLSRFGLEWAQLSQL